MNLQFDEYSLDLSVLADRESLKKNDRQSATVYSVVN